MLLTPQPPIKPTSARELAETSPTRRIARAAGKLQGLVPIRLSFSPPSSGYGKRVFEADDADAVSEGYAHPAAMAVPPNQVPSPRGACPRSPWDRRNA